MARLRHADCIEQCPSSGAKRKTYARGEFFSISRCAEITSIYELSEHQGGFTSVVLTGNSALLTLVPNIGRELSVAWLFTVHPGQSRELKLCADGDAAALCAGWACAGASCTGRTSIRTFRACRPLFLEFCDDRTSARAYRMRQTCRCGFMIWRFGRASSTCSGAS
jgi:hypothetical protein